MPLESTPADPRPIVRTCRMGAASCFGWHCDFQQGGFRATTQFLGRSRGQFSAPFNHHKGAPLDELCRKRAGSGAAKSRPVSQPSGVWLPCANAASLKLQGLSLVSRAAAWRWTLSGDVLRVIAVSAGLPGLTGGQMDGQMLAQLGVTEARCTDVALARTGCAVCILSPTGPPGHPAGVWSVNACVDALECLCVCRVCRQEWIVATRMRFT